MQPKTFLPDARYFQIISQVIFLVYGIFFLHWEADYRHYILVTLSCLIFNYTAECIKKKQLLPFTGKAGFQSWGLSILISAASLCLLLKVNAWHTSIIAALLTVASKYIFRIGHKHLFNPSAFGIVATIILTGDAWLSAGQWGSTTVIFFAAVTLGIIVVTRVQKLDVSLAFLFTFIGLLYWRQVYTLQWPLDHFLHSVSTGSLLLFSFFMISDPRTAPDHPYARILWAVLIAMVSFYLAAFKWKYNTPIWVLVAAAPMVPLLDRLFREKSFQWEQSLSSTPHVLKFKNILMKSFMKKATASVLLLAMVSHEAAAFCGFYVSKADGTLKNKTSQVIMVRDGDRNVITMYNDFQGNFKDFAMVVPVPVVLKKSDIKVVSQQIFNTLNEYSKPRLVEYYDQNPCMVMENKAMMDAVSGSAAGYSLRKSAAKSEERVKIEAKYIVGEYDILILSAKESSALKSWLDENGYKIPKDANEVLEPYIKSNLKFFVVKVNEEEKKKLPGNFLRPIQISFTSPKFMLPIRLGMANADGDQDMLVYAFTKKGRVECTNYRTVAIPTDKKIPLFVQQDFGRFYSDVFQHQWKGEGKSVVTVEYAWDVSPKNYVKCDPCVSTAPALQDLLQAGVWWLGRDWSDYSDVEKDADYSNQVHFTRLHVRYNRSAFPQDLQFQVTPNTASFQARYVITHPAEGDFDCAAGKKYLKELKERRRDELEMLSYLTGKGYNDWVHSAGKTEDHAISREASYKNATAVSDNHLVDDRVIIATIGVLGLLTFLGFADKRI